ncbi:hypothetical protein FRB99_008342, partial [Tulasnella sp. 403]
MDQSNQSQTTAVEKELVSIGPILAFSLITEQIDTIPHEKATALTSLKPFLLKRSWISIQKKDSEIGVGGF